MSPLFAKTGLYSESQCQWWVPGSRGWQISLLDICHEIQQAVATPIGGAKLTAPHKTAGVKNFVSQLSEVQSKEVRKQSYQNLTAKPLSTFPKSWGGQKCPKNMSSFPAPPCVKRRLNDGFLTLFCHFFCIFTLSTQT